MKLLITGALPKDETLFAELSQTGHDITYVQDERIPLSEQHIDPARFEGVICNGLFLYTPIEQFTALRFVQLTSAGFDRVPMDYIKAHDIEIQNARGVYSIPMAEFAVGGVLQLYKQSRYFYENQKNHQWQKHRGLLELAGKTVLIVGCGSVGTKCAKRFAAFDCTVVGIDLYPRDDGHYTRMVGLPALDDELGQADIIVLTLPLTNETRLLFDAARFSKVKPGATLVNIARGGIVDTNALLAALPNLTGAVLDVFAAEPLDPHSPLWDMENVILTPHNSFVGNLVNQRMQKCIIEYLSLETITNTT